MRGLPQFPGPAAVGEKQMNRSRKSRYVKPSTKSPEAQKPIEGRSTITPGWARKYRRDMLD